MYSNITDREGQLCPGFVHINFQDYLKSSTSLNSIICPINFELLWEAFTNFFFPFTLGSSIETLGVLQVHSEL